MSCSSGIEGSEPETPLLLTAKQKARELGVSVDFVRTHRDVLGVIRFGSGPRPRLMFPRGLPSSCVTNKGANDRQGPEKTAKTDLSDGSREPSGSHWRPIGP